MVDTNGRYKIVTVKDKTGIIAANHKTKELLVSKDIKLNVTDDGKLRATFPNLNPTMPKSKIPFLSKKSADTDCSVIISDPSTFNHCVQKDNIYQLSGSNVTFNGTDSDNTLILNGVNNSKINMGNGNDTVLYREDKTFNNNINLGDGNNIFSYAYKTDDNTPLTNNTISSGKGDDYIKLGYAKDNKIFTGAGKDLVEVKGHLAPEYSGDFQNNLIDTGKDNDEVNISGNFRRFSDNRFYLGKGSDNFSAEINPNEDLEIKTEFDYQSKLSEYANSVTNNKIYATDGEKGFFEKNMFESTTYSANQLANYTSSNEIEGVENAVTKDLPQSKEDEQEKSKNTQSAPKLTREDYARKYQICSFGAMLFNDSKMQEKAFEALDNYVKSMIDD